MMMRARFLRDLEAIKQGRDPSALIRDPAMNEAVELPGQNRQANIEGPTLEELMSHRLTRAALMDFVFLAGQPPEIRRAFEDAMGIRGLRERVGSRGGASAITEMA
jgi:5,5'-dehydrodivanillate O-demethylase